jgi:hypothetical protein
VEEQRPALGTERQVTVRTAAADTPKISFA